MPSQPLDSGWDFSTAIGLIDSGTQEISSPPLRSVATPQASTLKDGGIRLGSFSKLFENLGFADTASAPLPPLDPESELSNSDDALLPSPVLDSTKTPGKLSESSDEQATDNTGLTKTQRKKARRRAEKELEEERCRQQAVQDTLAQLAEEREQRQQQPQQVLLRKQLDDIASITIREMKVAETLTKPSRAHSRSNVGAKIRSATPTPASAQDTTEAPQAQQKQPRTPKTRPSILKRPSAAQPVTPQPPQEVPAVVPSTAPAPTQTQNITFDALAPASSQDLLLEPQQAPRATTPVHHGLVPRTVRPVTVPRTCSQPAVVQQPPTTPTPHRKSFSGQRPALTIRSQVERHYHLFNKLMETFPDDRKWLVAPMQMLNERNSAHGLHVFVDASNIMIGLKDMLRYHGLHHNAYDMSFDSLALLMERRRPVAKRFFAGSHREANPLPHVAKLVETSKAVGYDSVMQEQVLIVREDSEKKKFFNDVKKMGWHKATQIRSSGSGSDSETGPSAVTPKTPSAPKWVEQGVDEILHLKMCQSIIDTEVPSTMVLATGDGAVAEMSDGFLAHVERALKKGWKVELISWGQQINGGYRRRQFRAKWAEQFTIIELDEFLEDLIDTP